MYNSPPYITEIQVYIHCFPQVHKQTHMVTVSLSVYVSILSQTHMYTHRCLREGESPLNWKSVCLKMKGFTPTAYMQSLFRHLPATAHTVAEACATQTLQLASLPTPINAATHLHPFLSLSSSLSMELWYYSSSQGTERHISAVTWTSLRRISSRESLRHSSLVFPVAGVAQWALRRGTCLAPRRAWKTTLTMMLDNCFPFTHVLRASDKNSLSL